MIKNKYKTLILYVIVMLAISFFLFAVVLNNDENNETSNETTTSSETYESLESIESETSEEIKESLENVESSNNIESETKTTENESQETTIKSNNGSIIESLSKQNKIISLEEGLRLLKNDIEDENVIVKQLDVNEHKKYIKNVCIEGFVNQVRISEFYLDDVRAGEKVYKDFILPYYTADVDYEKVFKLRKGDKVTAVVTICEKYSDEYDRYSDDNDRDFHIVVEDYNDIGKVYLDFDTIENEDEIELKYKDKEKTYNFEDVYEDLTHVFSENYYRGMNIFKGIKIKTKAKVDSLLSIYDHCYFSYKLQKPILDSDKKYDTAIMNYLGYDNKQKTGLYAFSNESILVYKGDKEKHSNTEVNLIAEIDRLKRSTTYEDIVFKLGVRSRDIKFSILEDDNKNEKSETSSKVNNIKELKLETFGDVYNNLDKVKVVGQDKIYLYDDCCFGHVSMDIEKEITNPDTGVAEKAVVNKVVPLIWKVINIDEKDDNKVLLLLETPGIIDKMTWSDSSTPVSYKDSSIRKFLNGDFYNNHFSSSDKSKIFESEIISTIFKSFYDKIADETITTRDKVFILSSQEIKDYNRFFFDQYQTSFIRDQRYGKERYSLYRRNTIVFPYGQGTKVEDHEQETYKRDEKWYVYPAIYVDAKVR